MHTNSENSTNGNLSAIIEGLIIELKKNSNELKDKQRLPVFEETLRQMEKDLVINIDAKGINDNDN